MLQFRCESHCLFLYFNPPSVDLSRSTQHRMTKALQKNMHLHQRRTRRPRTHRSTSLACWTLRFFLHSPSILKAKSHGICKFQSCAWQGDHIVSLSVLLQTRTGCHRRARTITHLGRTSKASVSLLILFRLLRPCSLLCGRRFLYLRAVLSCTKN